MKAVRGVESLWLRVEGRNRRWLLVAIPILLALCVWLFSPASRRPVHPSVSVAFAGFTNSGTFVEALFSLTNPPALSMSLQSVHALGAKAGSVPVELGNFSYGRKEPWGLTYAISVGKTNEPLEVVLRFQELASGPTRAIERVREIFGDLTHKPQAFFTGPVFFVTNQIPARPAR